MPGLASNTPSQMFDHELNARKGWSKQYAVDKTLPLYMEADADNFGGAISDFKAGMVAYLAEDGSVVKFRLGLKADSMPCFIFQNGSDYDVNSDFGGMVGSGSAAVALSDAAFNGTVGGNVNALVAIGGYELESTEIISTDVASLAPNLPLTAVGDASTSIARSGGVNANPGKLALTTWATWRSDDTVTVIGVVSDQLPTTNEFGKNMVRFWPVFMPSPAVAE